MASSTSLDYCLRIRRGCDRASKRTRRAKLIPSPPRLKGRKTASEEAGVRGVETNQMNLPLSPVLRTPLRTGRKCCKRSTMARAGMCGRAHDTRDCAAEEYAQ